MKTKILKRIRREYYWYCGDILDYGELCKATLTDTGETPLKSYADKYWRASLMDVIMYNIKSYIYQFKIKIYR